MNYLDEIEAELGHWDFWKAIGDMIFGKRKESMKYVCEKAKECSNTICNYRKDWPDGMAPFPCSFQPQPNVSPIPVEPERVKEDAFPQWHPPCGFQGLCHNGWGSKWCAECPWFDKAPSPGLLQRMGMCVWEEEKDWVVATDLFLHTREHALDLLASWKGKARMFRWSDGLKGE